MNTETDSVTIEQEDDEELQHVRPQTVSGSHQVARPVKALPVVERKTASEMVAQAQLLQQVMSEVMRPGAHYGNVPGTDKPVLFKAGSEILLSTFRIAAIPDVFDLSTQDCVKFRVLVKGVHQTTGIVLGVGVGECSTDEDKYKWRAAVCDEEWDDTPESRRRVKYKKGYGGNEAQRIKQVRQEPADLANTVLKMAKKRAQVDLTLTATGASDIFDQDLDEEGNLIPRAEQPKQERKQTTAARSSHGASGSGKKATEKQVGLIKTKLERSGKDIEDLKLKFEVNALEEVTMDQVNLVLAWIDGK